MCISKNISCYSWLIAFNFKVHQDAHIRISFYFIFFEIGFILPFYVTILIPESCMLHLSIYKKFNNKLLNR